MFWWIEEKSGIRLRGQFDIEVVLEEDQQNEDSASRNEEPTKKNVRRSTRMRTESIRLVIYERFVDQVIDADGDFIEEVMMMVESKPIDLDQAMNDSNCLAAMCHIPKFSLPFCFSSDP